MDGAGGCGVVAIGAGRWDGGVGGSIAVVSGVAGIGDDRRFVGWVERSDTHRGRAHMVMGIADAQPILRCVRVVRSTMSNSHVLKTFSRARAVLAAPPRELDFPGFPLNDEGDDAPRGAIWVVHAMRSG